MDALATFVLSSAEVKNFGTNWATFWMLGANFFTFMQAWSTWKQIDTIRSAEKAEGISLYFFAFLAGYCFSFIYYGWVHGGLTMVFNGLLGFMFVVVVFYIVRHRGVTKKELLTLLGVPLMLPIMVLAPQKEIVLFVYLFGIFVFLLDVPLSIKRGKAVGQVDIRFTYVFLCVGTFWFAYALSIKDVPLMIFNPLALLVYIWTIMLYRKYRKPLTAGV